MGYRVGGYWAVLLVGWVPLYKPEKGNQCRSETYRERGRARARARADREIENGWAVAEGSRSRVAVSQVWI